jgi:gliding motility-associated-like protein
VAGSVPVSVVAVSSQGCRSLPATTSGTINPIPTAPTVSDYSCCQSNGEVPWSALAKVIGASSVKWYASASSTTAITPTNVSKAVAGTTTMYAGTTSANGCQSQLVPVSVTVYPIPEIVNVDKTDLHNIQLEVRSGTSPYTYYMNQKSGSFSGIAELGIVMFGTHQVTVEDAHKCKTATTFDIDPIPLEPEKYFTPNDDGINDTWDIANIEFYPRTEIYIHDRFGKEVAKYIGEHYTGWDGKYLGNPLPSTDYWYVIQVRETGKRLVGHFLLKR